MEFFDLKRGKYLWSVWGCIYDKIKDFYINYIGLYVIVICVSEEINILDIVVWNIEIEDYKYLVCYVGVLVLGVCVDFKYCFIVGRNDKMFNIWNFIGKIN